MHLFYTDLPDTEKETAWLTKEVETDWSTPAALVEFYL